MVGQRPVGLGDGGPQQFADLVEEDGDQLPGVPARVVLQLQVQLSAELAGGQRQVELARRRLRRYQLGDQAVERLTVEDVEDVQRHLEDRRAAGYAHHR